jgi:hypothetical protein
MIRAGKMHLCGVALVTTLAGAVHAADSEFYFRYKMGGLAAFTPGEPSEPEQPSQPPVDPNDIPDTQEGDGQGGIVIHVTDLTPADYYWDNVETDTGAYVDAAVLATGKNPADVDVEFTATGSVPGISFNPVTRVVSGKPAAPGDYSLVVHAWNPDPNADGGDEQPWEALLDITYNIHVSVNLSPVAKIMNVQSATSYDPSTATTTYYDPYSSYVTSSDAYVGGFVVPDAAAAACATIDWAVPSSVPLPQAMKLTTLSKTVARLEAEPDYTYFDKGYDNTVFWYYPVKANASCKDAAGKEIWNYRSPKFLLRVLAPA